MSHWLLLLPPSESKAHPPGNSVLYSTAVMKEEFNAFSDLQPLRDEILKGVKQAIARNQNLEKIFKVRDEALGEAVSFYEDFNANRTLPAIELYNGIMYQTINVAKLSKAARIRLDENTLILSGLYGLLKATDRVSNYKLPADANIGGFYGKVCAFWKNPVSDAIRQFSKGRVIWDFLPELHRKMWDGSGEWKARHQVKFVRKMVRGGVAEWKTISHHSKALKGAIIKKILEENIDRPSKLRNFVHEDGYKFSPSLSVLNDKESLLVFAAE